MYQNVTVTEDILVNTKRSNSSEYYSLECGLYHSITDIVKAMNMLMQEKHNHTGTSVQSKCLPESKQLQFTSQTTDWVLHSSVQTWATFLEAMLCIVERESTSQASVCL